jgi:hypothetical protein
MIRLATILVLLCGFWPSSAHAQWALEGFLGNSASAPSTLTIHQAGQPTIRFTAHYETRPTEPSIYYAARLSRWWGRWGAFIGFIHHKIYLTNNPPEIQSFKVTFGYNLGGIGAAYLINGWGLLGSVGPVVSNPSSVVRGRTLDHEGGVWNTGNYINGVNLQVGVNRRFYVVDWAFVTADFRLSAAWAEMDIAGGTADTPNYAAHLLIGIGGGKRRGAQTTP